MAGPCSPTPGLPPSLPPWGPQNLPFDPEVGEKDSDGPARVELNPDATLAGRVSLGTSLNPACLTCRRGDSAHPSASGQRLRGPPASSRQRALQAPRGRGGPSRLPPTLFCFRSSRKSQPKDRLPVLGWLWRLRGVECRGPLPGDLRLPAGSAFPADPRRRSRGCFGRAAAGWARRPQAPSGRGADE